MTSKFKRIIAGISAAGFVLGFCATLYFLAPPTCQTWVNTNVLSKFNSGECLPLGAPQQLGKHIGIEYMCSNGINREILINPEDRETLNGVSKYPGTTPMGKCIAENGIIFQIFHLVVPMPDNRAEK